jgi:hypothetical protein
MQELLRARQKVIAKWWGELEEEGRRYGTKQAETERLHRRDRSSLCLGVIGKHGDMLGVRIAPVTAQVIMTFRCFADELVMVLGLFLRQQNGVRERHVSQDHGWQIATREAPHLPGSVATGALPST